ncbi:MAG: DUF1667 domain-containing protein [Candidatus Omnitrophota bacterium]
MIRKMICIECPKGCSLSVDIEGCKVKTVTGNKCPRGAAYAIAENEEPMRIFTATVATKGLNLKLIPVRTNKPIPKKDLFLAADETRKIRVEKPLKAGDTVTDNFLGLNVKLLATREVA